MLNTGRLTSYTPPFEEEKDKDGGWIKEAVEYNEFLKLAIEKGVLWLRTSDGKDFYELRNAVKESLTWKVGYDADTGRVYSFSQDIQQVPIHEGCAIIEVENIPVGFCISGNRWFIVDGEIHDHIENYQTNIRNKMFSEIDARINVLRNRIDDGDAEKKHHAELKRLREVRVALRKLDMKVKVDAWPSI